MHATATYKKGKLSALDMQAESEMCIRAAAGCKGSMETLLAQHMGMIRAIAWKFNGEGDHIDDLTQEGVLGFMDAIQRYEPQPDAKLATYASFRIGDFIAKYANEKLGVIRASASTRKKIRNMRIKADIVLQSTGSPATVSQLAELTGATEVSIRLLQRYELLSNAGFGTMDFVGSGDLHHDTALHNERLRKALFVCLNSFDHRDQEILGRYYGLGDYEPETLLSIGRVLNITESRVSQIRKGLIEKLRERFTELRLT